MAMKMMMMIVVEMGHGPPFKKGPSVKPGSTGGDFEPGQCNRLEKMVMAERRKKNPKAPSLICNSRMRKIAKLHAQNLLDDAFAGLVRQNSLKPNLQKDVK